MEKQTIQTQEISDILKQETKKTKKIIAVANQKKEKSIASRVSEKVYFELEKESKELGFKTVSAYLRNIVLHRKNEIDEVKLLEYKVFLMGKVSNNINQIAKTLNTDIARNGKIDHQKTCDLLQDYLINFKILIEE